MSDDIRYEVNRAISAIDELKRILHGIASTVDSIESSVSSIESEVSGISTEVSQIKRGL